MWETVMKGAINGEAKVKKGKISVEKLARSIG